jgi:hypothetical protein
MVIIESLVLLLLQGVSANTVNVRIVGEPEASAVLVGKPCEPDPKNTSCANTPTTVFPVLPLPMEPDAH